MHRLIFIGVFISITTAGGANAGSYTNKIKYADGWYLEDGSQTTADDPNRLRLIIEGVGYTDDRGHNWEVPAGNFTDGASIPWYLRWIIGGKFEPEFERPSALHDHYVTYEHRVRPAYDTHRMFLDALKDEGVDPAKANAMYVAVATFGSNWTTLEEGKPCEKLENCVLNSDAGYASINYFPGAKYTPEKHKALKEMLEKIDSNSSVSDLNEIILATKKELDLPLGDEG